MKLTFLGTGTSQGVPMIGCDCEVCRSTDPKDKRLRSSVLVQAAGKTLVIDTTPDFRYQMLREGVKQIDGILFTHAHKDHTAGLDDVRAFNYFMHRPVDIYAEPRCMAVIRKDFDYAFAEDKYPGVPEIIPHLISALPFRIGELEIIPIRGMHHKMPVLGFRIGSICYITDMNAIEESEIEKIKGVEVFVINALRHERHISHFTLKEALAIIEKVGAPQNFLTHLSHSIGLSETTSHTLPSNVRLGYDGLTIETD